MERKSRLKSEYVILAIVFAVGCAVRLWGISSVPGGLNQDEASIGYEAFALLTRGFDRNGVANPVHLIAWGSGQNIAYAWLCMPFIKLMGLSVLSVRLPMAIAGCVSVVVFYLLMKEIHGGRVALVAAAFFAAYPWHIMKSRWALESNIFPDLVLWGVCLLVYYIYRQKNIYLYGAVAVLAFSVYSYGTAYMFMPLFCGSVWLYMLAQRKITVKNFVLSAAVMAVLVAPMLLFVLINTTDMAQMTLAGFTIPEMYQQRFTAVTNSGDFMQGCIGSVKRLWDILLKQGDGLPWNSMDKYGICYKILLPLIPAGVILSFIKPA